MPRLRAVLVLGAAGALLVGCGRASDERDARRTAEALYSAVADHRGEAACRQLTDSAAEALEQQEGRSCAEAVTGSELTERRPGKVRVYETNAVVSFPGGEKAYLDRTRAGWRVSAAGCKPKGPAPADCELED